ncbi:hypothetical protein [Paenibacillus sp. Leaf72]|uniref:hypothetical protein n=1 Tax=Paenibacillus sp. Leaf72 TaxID=1736234 RepID=UPI0006F43FF4|nr:hypothetical protein [Paenibacillus sp. Leaf72]KQO17266.1 hypothetical protein ASF12_00795 [Paenibacillus sp. Leaf72]
MNKTLHFELVSNSTEVPLTLHIGQYKYALHNHTPQTLLDSTRTNSALALIPEQQRQKFTHFVEISESLFQSDRLTRIRVTSPDHDPNVYLPKLHHVSFHIPKVHRVNHIKSKLAANSLHLHPKLTSLGVAQLNTFDALQVNLDAEDLLSPWDIATAILFHYPELSSNKPYTANIVMNDHIAPPQNVNPAQYNQVYNLATIISKQGPASSTGGWAKITNSVDQNGTPLTYGYDMGTHKAGDPILIYSWSDLTVQNATSPMTGAMQSASNDNSLQNQTWTVNQGKTAYQQDGGSTTGSVEKSFSASRAKLAAVGDQTFKWTVKEETPHHGLGVYADTISFSDDGKFSIQVKNTYLRTLTAYAEFFNENGDAISNPSGWVDQLPSSISSWFETDKKKYISSVSAVNTILGIPMPTDPKTLSFVFPEEATQLKLLFGCLGTSKWDGDVDPSGAILTGIFQYGIPSVFLIAGAAITSSKWFNEFVSDTENVVAALAVAFPIVGGGVATAAALTNAKSVLFSFADAMAGILLAKGLEKLALYITGQITVAELEDEVPFVGWALRAANMAINFAEMAVTTGEILSSPATLSIDICRSMNLNFTLHPDPTHGEPGHPETAVWPAVSDHYQVTVQYKGGTNFVLSGNMPATTSNTPLQLTFADLPVGGSIQITAGIYSANVWLCGKYQSEWMDAFPSSGSSSLSLSADITEILVPLTQDTQYNYKEKIIYDQNSDKHVWHAGDLPTATLSSLDCSSGGHYICKPVDITLNDQAYQIGYVWSASGQNYMAQNVSVLADPQSRYKSSEVQLTVQPYIAYDQFGLEPDGSGQETVSLNNFILDTRNSQMNLRQVNLMDGESGFGLNDPNLKSWGRFNLSNIDAMVVHPDGAVIAVSWKDSKMEILQIPDAPTDDAHAPDAQMVSGLGVRQGLLQGPKSISVTPDGRVLILETLNKRIQAFDTKGNPVSSFLGDKLFTLEASVYSSDLDNGIFSDALQLQFQENGLTHIFDLDESLVASLNQGQLSDNIINAFAFQGVFLTYESDQMSNHEVSTYVTVVTSGAAWTITDPNKNAVYNIKKNDLVLNVFDVLNNVTVDVRAKGSSWVVEDWNGAQSYYISTDAADSQTLNVNRYLSFMLLYNPENRTDITYLDVAVEAKGYLYVLSYVAGGKEPSDYFLDIYNPDGTFLVRTPDSQLQPTRPQFISAAKLVVDVWRNVYTLNYEPIIGPNNTTEPSISHWIPTPPLFDLPLSDQSDFNNANVAAVQADFSANGITLANPTTIQTINPSGYWKVSDSTQTYDVIRSGSNLEVYSIPVT